MIYIWCIENLNQRVFPFFFGHHILFSSFLIFLIFRRRTNDSWTKSTVLVVSTPLSLVNVPSRANFNTTQKYLASSGELWFIYLYPFLFYDEIKYQPSIMVDVWVVDTANFKLNFEALLAQGNLSCHHNKESNIIVPSSRITSRIRTLQPPPLAPGVRRCQACLGANVACSPGIHQAQLIWQLAELLMLHTAA